MRQKTARTGLSLLAAYLLFAPAPASAQQINLPPITRVTWPNGIRLFLMEYHRAPSITVTALFPGGSSVEQKEKAGIADMTSELLRKGTTTRTAPQIAEEIDFLGGSLSAGAGEDRLSVGLGVLARDTDKGLELFADVIRNPTFPQEELERTRQLSLAGLNALIEDPEAVSRRVTTAAIYAGHPYGGMPTVESVQSMTRQDAVDYHRRFVVPDRMIIVAVGDFQTADMVRKLHARFGDWKKAGLDLPAVPAVGASRRRLILVDKPDATQSQVRWVRRAIPRNHPDYFPAMVAESILGGGFTSRLVEEIRVARSLTYSVGSSFRPLLRGGTFGVATFTKVETTRALVDATNNVLRSSATRGFTASELSRVKGYLAGMFAISVQTPEALAGQIAEIAFHGLPADYLKTYLNRIRAVTLADVNRIAKNYMLPEALSLIVVGPGGKVSEQLRGIGSFENLPVETVGKTDVTLLQRGAQPASAEGPKGAFRVDEKTKQRIDRWIKEKNRNNYGDPKDTMYAGGTPLFDERTGKTKDRYEYILEKHPELRKE